MLLPKAIVIPPYTSPAFLTYCPNLVLVLTEVSALSIIVPTPPPKLLKIVASEVSKSFTNSPPSQATRGDGGTYLCNLKRQKAPPPTSISKIIVVAVSSVTR